MKPDFRFQVITLTDAALGRLSKILTDDHPTALGIRIGIKKGGCAGMEYTIDLVDEINPKDDRVDTSSGSVFIAPEATLFLLGTELDFEISKLRSGFSFNNPNQISACGCGESVELKSAEYP